MKKAIYTKKQNNLVTRLKEARIEARFTQSEVAEMLEKTQSFISKIESGQRRIDVVQLEEFAKIYKKTLFFFTN